MAATPVGAEDEAPIWRASAKELKNRPGVAAVKLRIASAMAALTGDIPSGRVNAVRLIWLGCAGLPALRFQARL